jgi:hypothetical protein
MDQNTQQNIANAVPVQDTVAPQGVGNNIPAASEQQPDISKTTLAVLVILTLMISIIGTWTVLNEISAVKLYAKAPSSSSGVVKLNVLPPPGSVPAQASSTTGMVVMNII